MAAEADKQVERASCWIDREIHRLAKEVAVREGLSISEVIERDLETSIRRRHRKLFPAEYADLGEAGA